MDNESLASRKRDRRTGADSFPERLLTFCSLELRKQTQEKPKIMQEVFVIAKPDLVIRRGAGARMLKSFLDYTAGEITSSNELVISTQMAEVHYAHVSTRKFYKWLLAYISCYESYVFTLKTSKSIEAIRSYLGSTIVQAAAPNSLRHKYGLYDGMNGLHVSESADAAEKEIANWVNFGVLQPGKLLADVKAYPTKYIHAPDNSKPIHDLLADEKQRSSLINDPSNYSSKLYSLVQQEAVNVDPAATKRFYNLVLEGMSVH